MGTPLVLGDRVLVTTTTTGTGSYSFTTAVTGYLTPVLAGMSSGVRVPYVVLDSLTAPTAFEVGEGVYTAGSPATLSRATIRRNTSGGTSAINWGAGTKYIAIGPTAANIPLYDTDGYLIAATPPNGTNSTVVPTTAHLVANYAPLASPALTGAPTAPTAAFGTNTTQLATMAALQSALLGGPVRAWCCFSAAGTIVASYNVASITKNGTGDYTFTFTSALPSANFLADGAGSGANIAVQNVVSHGTGSVTLRWANTTNGTATDPTSNARMMVVGG